MSLFWISTLFVLILDVQSFCQFSGPLKTLKQIENCRTVSGDLTIGQNTDTSWSGQRRIKEISGCLRIENSRLENLAFLDLDARLFSRKYNCSDGRLPMIIVSNKTFLNEETRLEEMVRDLSPGKVLIRIGNDCRHLSNVSITSRAMLTDCHRFYGQFRLAFRQPPLNYRLEMTLVGCLNISSTNLTNLDWLQGLRHSRRDCPTGHLIEKNPRLCQSLDKDWKLSRRFGKILFRQNGGSGCRRTVCTTKYVMKKKDRRCRILRGDLTLTGLNKRIRYLDFVKSIHGRVLIKGNSFATFDSLARLKLINCSLCTGTRPVLEIEGNPNLEKIHLPSLKKIVPSSTARLLIRIGGNDYYNVSEDIGPELRRKFRSHLVLVDGKLKKPKKEEEDKSWEQAKKWLTTWDNQKIITYSSILLLSLLAIPLIVFIIFWRRTDAQLEAMFPNASIAYDQIYPSHFIDNLVRLNAARRRHGFGNPHDPSATKQWSLEEMLKDREGYEQRITDRRKAGELVMGPNVYDAVGFKETKPGEEVSAKNPSESFEKD